MAVPRAIQLAFDECVEIRQSLPVNYFQYMGAMHSDKVEDPRRKEFTETCTQMMEHVMKYLPSDSAADQMAINFSQRRLPPYIPKKSTGDIKDLNIHSTLKLVSNSAARLVVEDDVAAVYSPMQNQREYHAAAELRDQEGGEEPEIGLEFTLEEAHAVDFILLSWPRPFPVEVIPMEKDSQKLDIARRLYDYGILEITKAL